MYRVEVTPVLGLPQFTGWSQVVTNQVGGSAEVNKFLVCALAVSGEHAGNAGRSLADFLRSAHPASAADFHQLLLDLQTEARDLEIELNLAAGLFSPEKMALAVLGGSILLKRSEKIGLVLRSSDKFKFVEGRHQSSDVLVLLSEQANSFLNEIEQKFLRGFGLDSVVTSIVPGLHDLQDSSLSSLAFVSGGEAVTMSKKQAAFPQKNTATIAKSVMRSPVESEMDFESMESDSTHQAKSASTEVASPGFNDIPPALKLRGAGRKRQQLGQDQLDQVSPDLQELGQTHKKVSEIKPRFNLKQLFSLISNQLSRVCQWLQKLNWIGCWSQLKRLFFQVRRGLSKISTRAISFWRRLTAQDIYLPTKAGKRRFKLVWLLTFFLVATLAVFGYRRFQRHQQENLANEALKSYQEQLTEVRDLVSTNPVVARQTVTEVMLSLEELGLSYEDQPWAQKLVVEEINQARSLAEEISGLAEIDQLEIFFDLRTIDENFVASQVDAVNQRAAFLDEGRQTVLSLDLTQAEAQEFLLENDLLVRDLAFDQDSLKLLGSGVGELDLAAALTATASQGLNPETIIPEGDSNRLAKFVETYASYVYVFNAERRDIYRYSQQDTGYSEPIGWVSGAVSFDYEEVSSWAIDGEIWIATRQGGLHRLSAGAEQDFAITGLEQPFTSSLKVFTDENLSELYLLEPDQERLVVLNKDGQFVRELKSPSLATTTDLFVSESGQVFTVSGSIIYALDF